MTVNEMIAYLEMGFTGMPTQTIIDVLKQQELEIKRIHPVKELTDEEIEEIGKQYLSAHAQFIGAGECHYEGEIDFARAILKKAKE